MKYTASSHQGQWFVTGPNQYMVRTGYGHLGERYANVAMRAWNRVQVEKDLLSTVCDDKHRFLKGAGDVWSVVWGQQSIITTGSGKRGEYHAKMLTFIANGQANQAKWYHDSVIPRVLYVWGGSPLIDESLSDYAGNPIAEALADVLHPDHTAAGHFIWKYAVHPNLTSVNSREAMTRRAKELLDAARDYTSVAEVDSVAAMSVAHASAMLAVDWPALWGTQWWAPSEAMPVELQEDFVFPGPLPIHTAHANWVDVSVDLVDNDLPAVSFKNGMSSYPYEHQRELWERMEERLGARARLEIKSYPSVVDKNPVKPTTGEFDGSP